MPIASGCQAAWKGILLRSTVLALVAGSLSARRALAAPSADPPLDLVWKAPDGCPSQAEVASDVLRLVGTPKVGTHVRSFAVVTRGSSGSWSVRVTTVSDAGTDDRSMEGESCRAVAEATALFVALASDPGRGGSVPAIEGAPSPPPVPPFVEPPRVAPRFEREPREHPAPPSTASEHSRISLGASSRVDSGTLPRAAVGAELSAGWRTSRTLLEVAVTDWLTQGALLSATPSVGGTFSMISASLRGCYDVLDDKEFILGPCAGGEFDHVDAGGYGSLVPATGSTWWIGLAAGGTVGWRFTHFSTLRGLIEADAPLARPRFFVGNAAATYQASVISARGGIGVELAFP
jgi:hypothetical protein